MGLDFVEFIMAVEEAFQIAISDKDAGRMTTPASVVTHILGRVGGADTLACLGQRAFYKVRLAAIRVFAQPRSAIKPDTHWDSILPGGQRRRNWRILHQATGTPWWPSLTLLGSFPQEVTTVGGTARRLAAQIPAVFKQPQEGWSQRSIENTIKSLMLENLGIKEFRWDQEFVKDLGVD